MLGAMFLFSLPEFPCLILILSLTEAASAASVFLRESEFLREPELASVRWASSVVCSRVRNHVGSEARRGGEVRHHVIDVTGMLAAL